MKSMCTYQHSHSVKLNGHIIVLYPVNATEIAKHIGELNKDTAAGPGRKIIKMLCAISKKWSKPLAKIIKNLFLI